MCSRPFSYFWCCQQSLALRGSETHPSHLCLLVAGYSLKLPSVFSLLIRTRGTLDEGPTPSRMSSSSVISSAKVLLSWAGQEEAQSLRGWLSPSGRSRFPLCACTVVLPCVPPSLCSARGLRPPLAFWRSWLSRFAEQTQTLLCAVILRC